MRKSELIEQLNKIEGDPKICISSDSEGNRIQCLDKISEMCGQKDRYEYDVYDLNWNNEESEFDSEEEWEQFKSNSVNRVIVLWP
jgi:hypothetical protein